MFLIEDIFTASGLGLVDVTEDRAGSSLKTSSGMAVEKIQKAFQFRYKHPPTSTDNIKGAASSGGITYIKGADKPTCIDYNRS